jgi:KDO2-lipid IV(A) lauroyltransferase
MKKTKYFLQAIIVFFLFLIFKIIGLKYSRLISSKIITKFGPQFRSREIIKKNLSFAFKNLDEDEINRIIKNVWANYGKIFAEYVFIKKFRIQKNNSEIRIKGQNFLEDIKKMKEPVIFISGHFDNFELMAMKIEQAGIDLTAIYRPLNNIFLNPIMENIRVKYICKKQIKKGLAGTKQILKNFKCGSSIALMIDQRVSQGIKTKFFSKEALTTTIPAQFVKKFKCKIVPIYIERDNKNKFNIEIFEPKVFPENETVETITLNLNKILEKMLLRNPSQWIWTHDRWK